MSEIEYSPGVKSAVSKANFWTKEDGRIKLYDYIGEVGSFPISTLEDQDLEAIKTWTKEVDVR